MADVALWIAIGVAYCALLVAVGYFGARFVQRRWPLELESPACDRCGKSTGKPYLWTAPRRRWHCESCDAKITELIFEHPSLAKEFWKDLY